MFLSRLTFQETPPLSSCNLPGIQSHAVHLHTRNPSPEEAAVTNSCPHSNGIIRCQPKPSNALSCNHSAVQIQFGRTRPFIVRCTNVLPSFARNAAVLNVRSKASSSSTRKTNKERNRGRHPEVYTPAVRHVVENRPSTSLIVDPSQKGDRSLRVQLSVVREVDVAVWFSQELRCSVGSSVRTRGLSNIAQSSRWIGEHANVSSLSSI